MPDTDPQPMRRTQYALRVIVTFAAVAAFVLGTLTLYIALGDEPFGIQIATAVVYTCVVAAYTFLPTNLGPGYKFKDPTVRSSLPRLSVMHIGFLAIILGFQTAMFAAKPHLPQSWLVESGSKHESVYEWVLMIPCILISAAQILWFRRILHRSFLRSLQRAEVNHRIRRRARDNAAPKRNDRKPEGPGLRPAINPHLQGTHRA